MIKTGIFTGGNDKYIHFITNLLDSIINLNINIPIYIIDGGLSKNSISQINLRNCKVLNYTKLDYLYKKDPKSKINILRLRINEIVDKYDLKIENIIWLDADTWVQTPEIFNICNNICQKSKLGIKSQSNRYDKKTIRYKNVIGNLCILNNILYKNSKKINIKAKDSETLKASATLNSGVFCLPYNSSIWNTFKKWQEKIINDNGNLFSSDQLVIGCSVYIDNINYEILPDNCNYFFGYPIRYSTKTNKFLEYYPPYNTISVLHYCGIDKFKENWFLRKVEDENDNKIIKDIRYNKNR